jgi:hypothetical protein
MSDAGRTKAAAQAEYFEYRKRHHGLGVPSWDDITAEDRESWLRPARIHLTAADAYDREHGIVHLDTRDSTLPSRLAAEIAERQAAQYPNTLGAGEAYWLDAVNRTLAALAAVGAQREPTDNTMHLAINRWALRRFGAQGEAQ